MKKLRIIIASLFTIAIIAVNFSIVENTSKSNNTLMLNNICKIAKANPEWWEECIFCGGTGTWGGSDCPYCIDGTPVDPADIRCGEDDGPCNSAYYRLMGCLIGDEYGMMHLFTGIDCEATGDPDDYCNPNNICPVHGV